MADILRLYSQGRAKTATQLWDPEEHNALYLLVKERNLSVLQAADYVRNGILTLDDYDKATKKGFKPEKLDDVLDKAADDLRKKGKKAVGKKK